MGIKRKVEYEFGDQSELLAYETEMGNFALGDKTRKLELSFSKQEVKDLHEILGEWLGVEQPVIVGGHGSPIVIEAEKRQDAPQPQFKKPPKLDNAEAAKYL